MNNARDPNTHENAPYTSPSDFALLTVDKVAQILRVLVFCTRKGGALERRNLLRHIKVAAADLGLSKAVDFRSFRTMHSSLMLREGARPEVVRDNMGAANIDVTQNVWQELVGRTCRRGDPR